jgi:polyisoprenoid-binding protein YceI
MKNIFKQIPVLIAICIIGLTGTLHAQSVYKLTESKDIALKLSGTSTLHNWTMNASTFTSEAQFELKPDSRQLNGIKSLNFSLAVQDLKSGESGLDKNAYKALKATTYKDIVFKLLSASVVPGKDNKYLVKAHGNLTIAGITKEVTINVNAVVNENGAITCTGSHQLNMTDYQVKPPTFMLGAMKTGDAITLDFTLVYKNNQLISKSN